MKTEDVTSTVVPLAVGAAVSNGTPTRRRWLAGLPRSATGTHVISLADQAVVSGTSFLSMVLVARASNPSELGVYAIGISILTILMWVQDSLVVTPYTVLRHQPHGDQAEQAGSAFAQSALLAGLTTLVLWFVAILSSVLAVPPNVTQMVWALAFCLPFTLVREFGRRHAYAHLRTFHALAQDVVVSTSQIGGLAWLFHNGRMTAATAMMTLGGACLVTTLGWLALARRELAFDLSTLPASAARSWHLGKWLVGSRLSINVQGYVSYWLITFFFGPALTGVYAACMNVVSFSNPLVYGINNVLTPRAVLAWKEGGPSALWKVAIREALLLGFVAAVFCVVIVAAGDWAMRLLYNGSAFVGQRQTLVVLSLAVFGLAVSFPAASGLATMERTRAIFFVAALTSIATLVLVVTLVAQWGLLGAAYGYLAGNVITAAGRWVAFRRAIATAPAASLDTILSCMDISEAERSITRLGDGDHATAFMISSANGTPLWRGRAQVVIKLFKPEANLDRKAAEAQFDALAQLHRAIDGLAEDEWSISVAQPLAFNTEPLAIVMSAVGGTHFDHCTWKAEELTASAHAFAGAMNRYWRSERAHGDLGLQNVLFDPGRKRIDFIDPGTLESCSSCHLRLKGRSAVSNDCGHLLADLTRDLVHRRGTAAGRRSEQLFIEVALRAVVADLSSPERTAFLAELKTSVEVHLEDLASQAHGLKRLWHRAVLPMKQRCAHSILSRIGEATSNPCMPAVSTPNASAFGTAT